MSMIINPYAFVSGGSYLDGLAVQPRAVLSLRKLISTATVSIRVRRSSDSAEQDIGFTGDALDTASLATFVGANSAFVTTFYDQTGNGEDAVQTTAANQPRIVNAGVYDGQLVFDGTNDSLKITSLTQGSAYVGIYSKVEQATSGTSKFLFESSTAYDSNSFTFAVYDNSAQGGMVYASNNASGSNFRALASTNAAGQAQWSFLFDRTIVGAGELKAYRAGTLLGNSPLGSVEQTGTYTTYDLYIGARAGSSFFGSVKLETAVFYNADSSAIRTSIEALVA